MRRLLAAAVLALGGLTACGGVRGEGQIGDRAVALGQTAFGWLDDTVVVAEDGQLILDDRPSDDTVLHLVFSGAAFDPGADLAAMSAQSRLVLADEIARRDYLQIDVRRGDRLDDGDEVEWASGDAVPAEGPYVQALAFRLGHEALKRDATYPDEVSRLASGRRLELRLEEIEETRLAGTLELSVERADADQGLEVAEGEVSLTFDIERLSERVAECNYDPQGAGAVDPCSDLTL